MRPILAAFATLVVLSGLDSMRTESKPQVIAPVQAATQPQAKFVSTKATKTIIESLPAPLQIESQTLTEGSSNENRLQLVQDMSTDLGNTSANCVGGVCQVQPITGQIIQAGYTVQASQQVSYGQPTESVWIESPAHGDILYAADCGTMQLGGGSTDQHRHPLRSGVAAILNRGRMAAQTIRSNRPVATLLQRTRQRAGNLISAIRPSSIRTRIRSRACR